MSEATEHPSFENRVRSFLRRTVDGFRELVGVERLSGGASQETYRLELETSAGPSRLAFRRAPGATRQPGQVGVDTEAQLICAARAAGVPEPQVVAVLEPNDGLGEGFVMEWLEGETLGKRINTAEDLADARKTLAFDAGATLARIHAIDVEAAGLTAQLTALDTETLIRQTWNTYLGFDTPIPMIDYTAVWLLAHQPPPAKPALVHADFRNGNLMVGPRGLVAVLDWELAHIGDPRRDLGWLCTGSWRFGRPDLPVGGFGTRDQLFAGYESVSGRPVDPGHVHFWEVFGSFWWGVTCLVMADQFRRGPDRTIERAAIGRRSSECQIDCVNLLIPGPCVLPQAPKTTPALDMPSADELLGGIREFLLEDVGRTARGRARFMTKVAANALELVEREHQLGPATRAAELDRLRNLLGRDGSLFELRRALAQNLRDGNTDLTAPALHEHLRLSVASQVAIDQPRYHGLQTALAA